MDCCARIRALAARQDGLVTTAQALTAGMTSSDIRTRVRRGEWRALVRGVQLVDADLFAGELSDRTWWRAALLSQGTESFLVASTAVRAFGVAGLPPASTVEVAVPGGISRVDRPPSEVSLVTSQGPRIVVRQLVVPAAEVVTVGGLRARCAPQSLVDTGLNSDRPTALSIFDSALHCAVVSRDELDAAVICASGRRGVVALRRIAQLADHRAESPLESRVRLACVDGFLPPNELQHEVRDEHGRLIAVGDMAWLRRRRRPLIAEADGADVHSLPEAVFRDRRRTNALAAAGYDIIRFTWSDSLRPARIVAAVRAALQAA